MQKKSMTPSFRGRRASELDPFEIMRNNNLFQDMWSWPPQTAIAPRSFMPTVETSETRNKVKVNVELPGMTEDEVQLTLSPDGDYLTLSGEKKLEEESVDEENNFYHFERSYGSFQRHIPLPSAVDSDKVNAKFKNGVLKVTMAKKAETNAMAGRQIRIEV